MGKPLKVHKNATGLIDSRKISGTDDGLIIKKKQGMGVKEFFKTDQTAAIAFYMSDLLAKGFNDEQVKNVIKERYGLDWSMTQLRTMKTLIRKLWRAQMAADMNEQITEEVNAINVQIKELWAAWELSKKGISTKTTRNESSAGESEEMTYDLTETIVKEDTTAGDVKYMSLINDLGKEKRKLLGLYAPEKRESKENAGNTAIQINVVGADGTSAAGNILGDLLNNATPKVEEKPNESIEDAEAEVINAEKEIKELPSKKDVETINLDEFWEDMWK